MKGRRAIQPGDVVAIREDCCDVVPGARPHKPCKVAWRRGNGLRTVFGLLVPWRRGGEQQVWAHQVRLFDGPVERRWRAALNRARAAVAAKTKRYRDKLNRRKKTP